MSSTSLKMWYPKENVFYTLWMGVLRWICHFRPFWDHNELLTLSFHLILLLGWRIMEMNLNLIRWNKFDWQKNGQGFINWTFHEFQVNHYRVGFIFYEFLVIDTKKEGLKEVYVISDYENPKSPVIIHFILVNDTFRQYSSPDVPRAQGGV